jgi:hypothetical protein
MATMSRRAWRPSMAIPGLRELDHLLDAAVTASCREKPLTEAFF